MPFELTVVFGSISLSEIPSLRQCANSVPCGPNCIPVGCDFQAAGDSPTAWGWVRYSSSSPSHLRVVAKSWRAAFPSASVDLVHRLSRSEFDSIMSDAVGARSSCAAIAQGLEEMFARGVSTSGMLHRLRQIQKDVGAIARQLDVLRSVPKSQSRNKGTRR
jgi:hypothetical protein